MTSSVLDPNLISPKRSPMERRPLASAWQMIRRATSPRDLADLHRTGKRCIGVDQQGVGLVACTRFGMPGVEELARPV